MVEKNEMLEQYKAHREEKSILIGKFNDNQMKLVDNYDNLSEREREELLNNGTALKTSIDQQDQELEKLKKELPSEVDQYCTLPEQYSDEEWYEEESDEESYEEQERPSKRPKNSTSEEESSE